MKCTKCGINEANFHYVSNINGEKTEKHLCTECAREEGYASELEFSPMSISGFFDDMFTPMLSPSRMFSDPFGFEFSPMSSMRRALRSFPSFSFSIGDGTSQPEATASPASREETPETNEMSRKRGLNALKHSLEEAIKAEDFEKCITLRDQIKALEEKG